MMKKPSSSKVAIPLRKGLPSLLDGDACADSTQMGRFVAVLRKVRTTMAGDWVDACSSARRHATIVRAVDDVVSFVLLTECIRQRDHDVLPCLKDILSEARPLSARHLFTTAHKTIRSRLLKPVFAERGSESGLAMPTPFREDELYAGLIDGIHETFPSGMPVSVFGTFRLLRFEDPILPGKARAVPGRRVNPERHSRGIYYTPPALVDYLTYMSLEHMVDVSDQNSLGIQVLDPACGCGAFLIAGLRYLIARIVQNDLVRGPSRRQTRKRAHTSKNQRLHMLLESLGSAVRGVDTDAQAVEWTRRCLHLAFWESTREFTVGNNHASSLRAPDFSKAVIHADFLDAEGRTRGGNTVGRTTHRAATPRAARPVALDVAGVAADVPEHTDLPLRAADGVPNAAFVIAAIPVALDVAGVAADVLGQTLTYPASTDQSLFVPPASGLSIIRDATRASSSVTASSSRRISLARAANSLVSTGSCE